MHVYQIKEQRERKHRTEANNNNQRIELTADPRHKNGLKTEVNLKSDVNHTFEIVFYYLKKKKNNCLSN